jgi:hypothetical protein
MSSNAIQRGLSAAAQRGGPSASQRTAPIGWVVLCNGMLVREWPYGVLHKHAKDLADD